VAGYDAVANAFVTRTERWGRNANHKRRLVGYGDEAAALDRWRKIH
jgi:hypothetical protein